MIFYGNFGIDIDLIYIVIWGKMNTVKMSSVAKNLLN